MASYPDRRRADPCLAADSVTALANVGLRAGWGAARPRRHLWGRGSPIVAHSWLVQLVDRVLHATSPVAKHAFERAGEAHPSRLGGRGAMVSPSRNRNIVNCAGTPHARAWVPNLAPNSKKQPSTAAPHVP